MVSKVCTGEARRLGRDGVRDQGRPPVQALEQSERTPSRGFAMTYRAPVNDMLFMMRHVGQLDRAIRDGIYPDLSIDVVQDILEEAARFSRAGAGADQPVRRSPWRAAARRHRHHGAGLQGGLPGLGRRRLERARRSDRIRRTGPAAAAQCRLLRDVEWRMPRLRRRPRC